MHGAWPSRPTHPGHWLALLAPLAVGGAALAAEPAGADPALPANPQIEWRAADTECSGQSVRQRMAPLVQPSPRHRPMRAVARLARVGGRLELELTTLSEGHEGRRTIQGDTCEELEQAVALVLAMALESAAVPAVTPPPESPPPESPPPESPPPEPPPAEAPPPDPPVPEPDDFWVLAEGSALLRLRSLPGIGVGAGARLGVQWGLAEVTIAGGWAAGKTTVSIPQPSTRLNATLLEASLSACGWLLEPGPVSLGPCIALGAQRIEGTVESGTPRGDPKIQGHFKVGGAGRLHWSWGYFALRADLVVENAQPLRVGTGESLQTLFQSETPGLGLQAGVGARF